MRNCFIPLFAAASIFLTACGPEEPPIKVNEKKYEENHPKSQDDMSGNVEVTERTYEIKLQAPTPAWSVKIESVYVVGEEIWVICDLSENKEGMVAQVITEISDSVTLKLPDISPTYYVIGQQIGPDQTGVKFIDSKSQIEEGLSTGEQVWPKQ